MKRQCIVPFCAFALFPFVCLAQQPASALPDVPSASADQFATHTYVPLTQHERLTSYVRSTFGLATVVEAGVRGGIDQALNNPRQWGGGAAAYGERFGSAGGEIVIRGTTEYVIADVFKEDLRVTRCTSPCSKSVFRTAFDDTFLARKGNDGHEAFSVARLIGPLSGSAVAVNTWYPSGSGGKETFRGAGVTFGYIYIHNLLRELAAR